MKKRIFTLLALSVLLSGVFSTVKAQLQVDSIFLNLDTTYTGEAYETNPPSVKFWVSGTLAAGATDTIILEYMGAAQYLGLPTSYAIKGGSIPSDSSFTISTNWNMPHSINGGSGIIGAYRKGSTYPAAYKGDTTVFYTHPEFSVKLSMKTAQYPGSLVLTVLGGNQNRMTRRIADDALAYVRDTAITVPFSTAEIANLKYGDTIYVKYLGVDYAIIIPGLSEEEPIQGGFNRPITIPDVLGAATNYGPGTHFIPSGEDFVFIITPSGGNRELAPVVTTGRGNDTEGGVKYEQLADGSWRVTIVRVQSTLNLTIDFTTSSGYIDNNKVWTNGSQLYITSATSGKASIYNAAGVLVKTITFAAGETTSASLPVGFYVVTVNGESYKISVK